MHTQYTSTVHTPTPRFCSLTKDKANSSSATLQSGAMMWGREWSGKCTSLHSYLLKTSFTTKLPSNHLTSIVASGIRKFTERQSTHTWPLTLIEYISQENGLKSPQLRPSRAGNQWRCYLLQEVTICGSQGSAVQSRSHLQLMLNVTWSCTSALLILGECTEQLIT